MFYRQLCNWIVYGDLLDRYDEFFIADAKCADEMFSYSDQVADVSKRSSDVNLQVSCCVICLWLLCLIVS